MSEPAPIKEKFRARVFTNARILEEEEWIRKLFNDINTSSKSRLSQDAVDEYAARMRLPKYWVEDLVEEASRYDGKGQEVNNNWNLNSERYAVSFTQFHAAILARQELVLQIFDHMDEDSSGVVTKDQLIKGLRKWSETPFGSCQRVKLTEDAIQDLVSMIGCHGCPSCPLLDRDRFCEVFSIVSHQHLRSVSDNWMKIYFDPGVSNRGQPLDKKQTGDKPWVHLVAGGVSGAVSKTLTAPLNNISVYGTVSCHSHQGLWGTVREMYQRGGLKAFYRGNLTNSLLNMPWKGVDFFTFQFYKQRIAALSGRSEPSDLQRLLCGGMAGATSEMLLYPLDLVTGRMILNQGTPQNMFQVLHSVVAREGVSGLYSGMGASVPGSMVYTGVSFYFYDTLRSLCRRWNASDVESQRSAESTNVKQESGGLSTSSTSSSPSTSSTSSTSSIPSSPWVSPSTATITPSTAQTLMCGMTAGWAGMTASFPLNVVRRRLQVQGMHEPKPSTSASSNPETTPGTSNSRGSAVQEGTYKFSYNGRRSMTTTSATNLSGGNGILPWGVPYRGCVDAFGRILVEEGWMSFFRGWTAMTLRIAPASGFSFLGYEWIKRSFGEE